MTRTSPKAKLGGKNHINLSVDTRYPSPVAATTLVKTITRCSFAKSPRASFISLPTTHASTSKPPDSISEEEYFRLLKKTDVLGHLLRVNDNLLEAEGLLLSATDDVQSRALIVVAQLRVDQLNGFYQSYCRDLHTAENVVAEEKAKGYLAISYVTGMSSYGDYLPRTSIQVTEVKYAEKIETTLKHVQVEKVVSSNI
ncbi:hypothetical protein DYB36_002831 [Aphanomyces astaci]|uniref:Uncharacterized protein n=1 Tax=Aphanomyces astaci TaxID=112090 RepID=A0A397AWN6_APHAT|nr:hypothetical protein DYB36_002831 [Aphanomyces astaci]